MAWPAMRIGKIARPIDRKVSVDPDKSYRLLGMRSQIGGPFLRETKSGSDISASHLNRVHTGDFVYSRLSAWQGSFGVIPRELDGAFVSGEFPIFEIDHARADARFLVFWFGLPASQKAVGMKCFGSTRVRFKREYFLDLSIPLPPLDEQRQIVGQLERLAGMIEERRKAVTATEADIRALLAKAFEGAIAGAARRPLNEVAPLVRRSVEIESDVRYPELGVRSFGRGTFHKPALTGLDVGTKKLFRMEPGDLLFNIVFAWEGAVAVVQSEDKNRFGSHRFLTCVTLPNVATPKFLLFYFLTCEGLRQLGDASPGGAGRNRTLGLKKLQAIEVPVPPIETQRWFDHVQEKADQVRRIRSEVSFDVGALSSAMLRESFAGGENQTPHSVTTS